MRLLVAPLSALAAAVMFFELKSLRGEPVLGEGGEVTPGRGATESSAAPGRAQLRARRVRVRPARLTAILGFRCITTVKCNRVD